MAKLQLSTSARIARGLPVVEQASPVLTLASSPVEQPVEISKTKARKIAYANHVEEIKRGISLKVEAMPTEEAQIRFRDVVFILCDIKTDLYLFKNGITDIPKMIESGLSPKAWSDRAQRALVYMLFERKLLMKKNN